MPRRDALDSTLDDFMGDDSDLTDSAPAAPVVKPSDVASMSDEAFRRLIDGEATNVDALAAQAVADKHAKELEEFKSFYREELEKSGFDTKLKVWRRPEPEPEPVEQSGIFESMDENSFQRLLAARAEGRDTIASAQTSPAALEQAFEFFSGRSELNPAPTDPAPDGSESWGSEHLFGKLVDD